MKASEAYTELVRRSQEISLLQSCAAVLGWDQQTYMPRKGTQLRGDQLTLLASLAHDKATDPRFGELLAEVERSDFLKEQDSVESANVREWRHSYDRVTKIPRRLVEELTQVTTIAQQAWQEARAKNHFEHFRPHLEKVITLKREEASAVGFQGHPYDALLDEYEPGITTAEVQTLFANLSQELAVLIQKQAQVGEKNISNVLHRDFPVDRQQHFAEVAAAAIGFDFRSGRLDVTAHPFCSGFGPGDCRLTTRYNPRFFSEAFFGVMHEAGHGMYEQGLPEKHFGTPVGAYCSLGIHESQSRLWENQVGRGEPFWEHFFPRLKQTFPLALDDVNLVQFLAAINEVKPSFIRVEADEATYNLHIILRFEMELGLISGDLAVADLPGAWNTRFQQLLGITPQTDNEGCLQDIHWSFGGVGYFPTYTLGNLYAAQFMDTVKSQVGSEQLCQSFKIGDYSLLRNWLRDHIYQQGRRYRGSELCARASGSALSPKPFLKYISEKLTSLNSLC